jgi:hypothetical protein
MVRTPACTGPRAVPRRVRIEAWATGRPRRRKPRNRGRRLRRSVRRRRRPSRCRVPRRRAPRRNTRRRRRRGGVARERPEDPMAVDHGRNGRVHPCHLATADGDRGGPPPGDGVAPAPGLGAPCSASGSHGGPPEEKPRSEGTPIGVGPQPPPIRVVAGDKKFAPHLDTGGRLIEGAMNGGGGEGGRATRGRVYALRRLLGAAEPWIPPCDEGREAAAGRVPASGPASITPPRSSPRRRLPGGPWRRRGLRRCGCSRAGQ